MFELKAEEVAASRSQIATLKNGRGKHRKYPPVAFTERGVLMLGEFWTFRSLS